MRVINVAMAKRISGSLREIVLTTLNLMTSNVHRGRLCRNHR